ncbi:MAG: hypothetical protein HY885_09150 [Deltaproteobacteria bacterium]|nr:hypothetical protein [Deltaproteobacteria bacterium]
MKKKLFLGPIIKVKRANEQIGNIASILQESFSGDRYAAFCDVDPQIKNRFLKVKLVKPLPEDLPLLVAELIYHLRSALDQMTVELARSNGADSKGVYFPFAGDFKEFIATGTQRKIQSLSPSDIEAICNLQPYKGGNDLLWALGKISNIDKHIDLIPVGSIARGMTISNATFVAGEEGITLGDETRGRLDDGIVILSVGTGGSIDFKLNTQINITADVIFGEVEFFKNWSLVPTLHQLTQLVGDIIRTIGISHGVYL